MVFRRLMGSLLRRLIRLLRWVIAAVVMVARAKRMIPKSFIYVICWLVVVSSKTDLVMKWIFLPYLYLYSEYFVLSTAVLRGAFRDGVEDLEQITAIKWKALQLMPSLPRWVSSSTDSHFVVKFKLSSMPQFILRLRTLIHLINIQRS